MPTAEDILMRKGSDVIACLPDTPVREAVHRMVEANVGCLLVEQDSKIIGIFTERDLLRRVVDECRNPDATAVREVMASPVHFVSPDTDILDCADMLARHQFRHLMISDQGEPVGVLSLRDIAIELHSAGA